MLGFFQAADVARYLNAHDTPIIGPSLTTPQSAGEGAMGQRHHLRQRSHPQEMAVFNEEGAFAGKKIGVVGTSRTRPR